jgi:N-acetylneuraminic acid mutarotase
MGFTKLAVAQWTQNIWKEAMHPKKIFFRCVMVPLIALSAFMAAGAVHGQNSWQPRAPFPAPPAEFLAVAASGKLYLFGGLAPKFVPRGLVFEYDAATDVWTPKKPMPLPSHHLALAEYNGKIYSFGGFKLPASGEIAWEPIDNSWEYDPATDTWKPLKPMPSKRGGGAAATVNGKIYVIGGAGVHPGSKDAPLLMGPNGTPHRSVGTVEEYDIASDTWRVRTSMPTARNHFVVAAVNGKIYAIGGRLASAFVSLGSDTDVVEEYDPATDLWGVPRARMSSPRASMVGAFHNERIYILGGEIQSSQVSSTFRTMEAYEPATNQWLVLPPAPLGRQPIAGDVIGDTLYVVSGDNGDRPLIGVRGPAEPFPFDSLRLSGFK